MKQSNTGIAIHLVHCYEGEYEGVCKYGEDDCPAKGLKNLKPDQEILDYNKRCAEFLGCKCSVNEQYELPNMMTFPPKQNSNLCSTSSVCCVKDMQFHSDWNWIHEIIEKIRKDVVILENSVGLYLKARGPISKSILKNDKESVVKAINEYLIWYEKTKN